eukprot:maker-scaffold1125_size61249-snap-gene-0.11 protein:Tk00349 transcript:maker-scaffold1125_size61249-snap-gene-0.11-mRNA-1 annotation:"carboxypeptidase b"
MPEPLVVKICQSFRSCVQQSVDLEATQLRMKFRQLVCLLWLIPNIVGFKSYHAHSLLSVEALKEAKISALSQILTQPLIQDSCQLLKARLDHGWHDFMCADDESTSAFVAELEKAQLVHKIILDKPSRALDHGPNLARSRSASGTLRYDQYPSFQEILQHLSALENANPGVVRNQQIGVTHEKRPLILTTVGRSPQGNETRAIWIDAGIHAREWIAPITALYLMDRIVDEFRKAEADQDQNVIGINWYFVAQLNPDGYEYSRETDRMWRKNRSPVKDSDCFGVDLNRNWDVVGFGIGASDQPCKDTYKGANANSEPEVRAASKALLSLRNSVRVAISLHSYGQLWLTSWGYKSQLPVDNDKMVDLGNRAVKAMETINGRKYKVGAAGSVFYVAGGASDDFAKARAHIPYAVTLELPGKSGTGFVFPPENIEGVGQESWAGMKVVAEVARFHALGDDPSLAEEQQG